MPVSPLQIHEFGFLLFKRAIFESAPKTPKTDFTGLQFVENQ